MAFVNKRTRITDNELRATLDECAKVASESANEARDVVAFIKQSINDANKNIDVCIEEIRKQEIKDEGKLLSLISQLSKIKVGFERQCDEVNLNVEKKAKDSKEFNITLFGRTKVGKSTLMEILTQGDGSSIGKGGQRTTTDVRKYKWQGLTVTDVPGIDAFKGETDDKIAYDAAKTADVVLFMISEGQPEATEADWLVRLKKIDKPIICLCNVKKSLSDEFDLSMFLKEPEDVLDDKSIREVIAQFHDFVKSQLPNEYIHIYVTQLQARYLANKKENSSNRETLIKASRFGLIEKGIIKTIKNNGVSFRRKCFLSIIDNPLYEQCFELFNSSSSAYQNYLLVKDKKEEFCKWQRDFVTQARKLLLDKISEVFDEVRASIPSFVEDNSEQNNFNGLLNSHIESYRINDKVSSEFNETVNKANAKLCLLFTGLEKESILQQKLTNNSVFSFRRVNITNWKRIWERIATFCVLIPKAGNYISMLFNTIAMFCDSREEKLKSANTRFIIKIRNQLDISKEKTKRKVSRSFHEKLVHGLLSDAYNRFCIMETTLLTLANSQRELGLKYLKHHSDISKRIIQFALLDMGLSPADIDNIGFVARVPGEKTVIGYNGENIEKINHEKISEKIGNKEKVWIFRRPLTGDLENQLRILCNYFRLPFRIRIQNIKRESYNHTVAYINKDVQLSKEQETNLLLLQQILNFHIIKR